MSRPKKHLVPRISFDTGILEQDERSIVSTMQLLFCKNNITLQDRRGWVTDFTSYVRARQLERQINGYSTRVDELQFLRKTQVIAIFLLEHQNELITDSAWHPGKSASVADEKELQNHGPHYVKRGHGPNKRRYDGGSDPTFPK